MKSKLISFIKAFLLYNVFKTWNLFHLISRETRPAILRFCGGKVGRNVYISRGVYVDNNVHNLIIGNNVLISPNVTFLFHKRDLKQMSQEKLYNEQPFKQKAIVLCDNTFVGIGAIIMPGVTIGEGAGVAAGSVVVKNVDPWTIVGGNPAKLITKIQEK